MNKKIIESHRPGSPENTSQPNQPQAGLFKEILLTRQELAQRWNCCVHTISRRHDLEAVRLSRRMVRYRLRDIEAIEAAAIGK